MDKIIIDSFSSLLDSIEKKLTLPVNVINQLKKYKYFETIGKGEICFKLDPKMIDMVEKGEIQMNFDNCYLNCHLLDFDNFNIEYFDNEKKKIYFKNGKIISLKNKDKINVSAYSNYYLFNLLKKETN